MITVAYAAAAPARHLSPGALVACGLVLLAAWVVSHLVWPNERCPRCGGSGKNAGSNSRRWGACGKCGGSGRRLRLGAAVLRKIMARKDKR